MAKKYQFNRRDFMKALGGAATFLPVLPSLFPEKVFGQSTTAPKRIIFIMNRNGQTADLFYPNVTTSQIQPNLFAGSIASMSGNVSALFGTSYSALKSKISILRGLDVIGPNDHNRCSFLCGVTQPGTGLEGNNTPFGASTDWIIEKSNAFYPAAPRIRTLRFANDGNRGFSFSNIGGTITALPFSGSDSSFFNNTFAGVGGGTPPPVGLDPVARKSFLVDLAIERLNLLSTNRRLSSVDSQRMSEHVSNLNDIKNGLVITAPPPPASCTVPSQTFYKSGDQIRKKYQNVFDSVVAAFTCGVSRIASIYIEDYDDAQTDYSTFHDVSHQEPTDAGHIAASTKDNGWISDRIAYLINKLNTTIDVDGRPMLENTLVFWGSEISCKQGGESHRGESMPILIAGWPDKFRMGSFIDFRTRPFQYIAGRGDFPALGRPYTQFLCSIMLAAGLQPSEFTPFGKNGYFGEFSPSDFNPTAYTDKGYQTVRNDPLPYFVL